MPDPPPSDERYWYLEGFTGDSHRLQRVPILSLPFHVGRHHAQDLTLHSDLVSQRHARIVERGEALAVEDLGSTNGTFVNQRRVEGEAELGEGDIVHFAQQEFRLCALAADGGTLTEATVAGVAVVPPLQVDQGRQVRELLDKGAVISVFQPIVALSEIKLLGYEVLGRGGLEGYPTGVGELFQSASVLGAEDELSRMLRAACVEDCKSLPGDLTFFINTHPAELGQPELIESLADLRAAAPDLDIAVEVHEGAVADPGMMRELRTALTEIDMRLAYDDFGAGQNRLLELADVPPDFLKFDIRMIRDIDRANRSRRKVLASLVELALELEIAPLAEGLERPEEAEACRDLGFTYGQGFLYGAPMPAASLGRGES
jgi:EAL domain-containing protein (putative c-di-GMP-specific phosphodiesterase class I)